MKLKQKEGKTYLVFEEIEITILEPQENARLYPGRNWFTVRDIYSAAFNAGLLMPNKQVFSGLTSRIFAVYDLQNNWIKTYSMRENWNGWNDGMVYSLPNWEPIGKIIYADSSCGQHRDVWKLEPAV